MLVDAQDDRFGLAVEAELEVGIAQTIAERLHFDDTAARKRRVNDPVQDLRRQGTARLPPGPAGFMGNAGQPVEHRSSALLVGKQAHVKVVGRVDEAVDGSAREPDPLLAVGVSEE